MLQCHADYYNLGSRRDSFYDTFTAKTIVSGSGSSSSSTSGITGGTIDEGDGEGITDKIKDIIKKINPFNPDTNPLFIWIEAIILLGIIILLILFLRRKKKCVSYQKTNLKESFQTIFKLIFILVGISAVIALIGYIYKNIKNISINTSFIQDPLIRDMILIGFIVILAIVLFKALHIRGEIKFGREPGYPKFHHDPKISRMQKKLNRSVLKDELRRKTIKYPKIKRVRIKK